MAATLYFPASGIHTPRHPVQYAGACDELRIGAMNSLERRTIGKVMRRLLPLLILSYFIAYLDRVNVAFAGPGMMRDLSFSSTVFGAGAGIFFYRLCAFRSAEQPCARAGWRARLDRAHYDVLGTCFGGNRLCLGRKKLLRDPRVAGGRRSRLFSRSHLLSGALAACGIPGAGHKLVHIRNPCFGRYRRTDFRTHPGPGRGSGAGRLAMAFHN